MGQRGLFYIDYHQSGYYTVPQTEDAPLKYPRARHVERMIPSDSGQLNWRRGLYRLLFLASVAWILGWGGYLSICPIPYGEATNDILKIPVILIGAPAALFAFGHATLWALRGFAPDEHSSNDGSSSFERSGNSYSQPKDND